MIFRTVLSLDRQVAIQDAVFGQLSVPRQGYREHRCNSMIGIELQAVSPWEQRVPHGDVSGPMIVDLLSMCMLL